MITNRFTERNVAYGPPKDWEEYEVVGSQPKELISQNYYPNAGCKRRNTVTQIWMMK
jgi:hypothetical protein